MPDVKFSNLYPYTDFHELNLDWVIKEVKYWSTKVGKTIQSIELTGTAGLVDTYTINYSDGSTSTFDVTNGNGIASVAKTGTAGLVDTYTITFQDGSTTTFEVTNGAAAVDPTLTLPDYAADAEVTGTIFRGISELREPVNLFNKDSELIRINVQVQYSSGYVAQTGSAVTHPIAITVGQKYSFSFSGGYYGDTINKVVRYCKADGTLGAGRLATVLIDGGGAHYGNFTAEDLGDEYHYVCVNVRATLLGSFMFVKGDEIPEYSPYFAPYYIIKKQALYGVDFNPIYGKKAAFTGDSICYGAGYTGGYAKIIGENNDMTISNIAVSGGTICSNTGRFCISASVDSMPAGYDYYIVEGGVNDASQEHGETLGALSSNYNAALDTTTLYGAMESLCKKLQLNFPGKKYGFVFPHNVYNDTSVWNTSWRAAMKECLKKWGIPYLDLSDECAQLRNLDALRIYTLNNDGWHPTEDGYKLYYVSKIEEWMKTL